ncbi:MAG: serine protease [Cyanobacteria bacterium P01_A01_bin.45]
MYGHRLKLLVCFGSASLMLYAWAININVHASNNYASCHGSKAKATGVNLAPSDAQKIYAQAQSITVKIRSSEFLGSGIILNQQDCEYTVLTNAHVVEAGSSSYQIQTSDSRIWQAQLVKNQSFGKRDLALLKFRTKGVPYNIATVGSSPIVGDIVFAGGFPATEDATSAKEFNFTQGKVSIVLSKALEGGYRIGYTNNIQKGMSGGPLVNSRGEVVGVNGMQAYPLWEIPSVYADGNKVDANLHEKINRLSWAVPMSGISDI